MINVLVTAIGGGGHGDQILKALRLASPGRYRIFGADANPSCPQASLVERFVTLPLARDPNYLDVLLRTCKELGVQALFHGCEPELQLFCANRKIIEGAGIFLPINDTTLIQLCMDKAKTNARLAALGFPAPSYVNVTSESEFEGIDWFPVVVKPAVGGGGSANVYIAQDMKELRALAVYLGLGSITSGFMIQEYVGTPDQEFTVGVLHDLDGRYVNSIAVKRHLSSGLSVRTSVANRTGRKELGPRLVISSGVSQGDIGRFPEVTSQCRAIADSLGSRGPLNIQCRFVDGIGIRRDEFDLSNGNSLVRFVGRRPEVVVHLAAAVPHSVHYPDSDFSAAITRAIDKALFEAAAHWGCRLVYASTCSLYDKHAPEVKFEDDVVIPRADSPYMRAKYDGERLFETLPSYGIMRVPAPIGPGLPDTVVAKRFLNQAVAGQTIRVWGTGGREQNYVDVSDISDIFIKAAFSSATGIFNIAADAPTTMLELAEAMVKVVNRGSFELSGEPDPLEVEYARYSNARAFEQLGWRPRKSLEGSIRSMYEACNENR